MRQTTWITAAIHAALIGSTSAKPVTSQEQLASLVARAFAANAPNGYTPQTISCPPNVPSIREGSGLSENETAWLQVRRKATIAPMQDLLNRMNITGFDASQYIETHSSNVTNLPNIGIAVSGGGYRALLNGAGVIEAFDSRTSDSTAAGQLGGLLQSTTYLAGLSGGSWLVGSLFANNFTSIDNILATDTSASNSGSLWQFDNDIFEGPDKNGIQVFNTISYYQELVDAVHNKSNAGFNTTITDYWGRALSYQLVNASEGGPAFTFSSVAQQEFFTNGSTPLPLLVTDSRAPGQKIVAENSTIFDVSPWEIGSPDPTLYAFAPLQYIGTNYSAGSLVGDNCVVGYDNIGYVMGTSSTLFNEALIQVNSSNTTGLFSSALQSAIQGVLEDIGAADDDIADWPNPFRGYNNATNLNANSSRLTLVDGGEDGQNIPLHPLIQPARHVDVIFAVDSSADSNGSIPAASGNAQNWPLGVSLIATYERSLAPIGNGTIFPPVPDMNTFVNLGLNQRPTFFGCNASNLSSTAPIIVYLPNAPYVFNSNTSTFDLKYEDDERNAIVLNAYNLATQGNSSLDSQWPACVGCAILSRSFGRTNTDVPAICTQCFDKYCWDGTINSTTPAPYVPALKIPKAEVKLSSAVRKEVASMGMALTVAVFTGFVLM